MLTIIGLSHAEDMANRATGGVSDYHQPALKAAIADDDSSLTVIFAQVLNFHRVAFEDVQSVLNVQPPFFQRPLALVGVIGNAYQVIVSTITRPRKSCQWSFQWSVLRPTM